MATRLQLRKGTTTEHNTFVGANGEVTVDTDKDVLVVHDGVTAGGFPVAARANANGTISLIKKDGTIIGSINAAGLFNNTLTSTATDQALTAAQGKVLKDLVDTKQGTSSAFGVGQSNQDVTASRVASTNYTNDLNKTILVVITSNGGNTNNITGFVNNVAVITSETSSSYGGIVSITFGVPAGSTYKVTGSFSRWVEFR